MLSEVPLQYEYVSLSSLQEEVQAAFFAPLFVGQYLISLLEIKSRTTLGPKYSIKMGPAVFIALQFPGLGHYQKISNYGPGLQNLSMTFFKETKFLAQAAEKKIFHM